MFDPGDRQIIKSPTVVTIFYGTDVSWSANESTNGLRTTGPEAQWVNIQLADFLESSYMDNFGQYYGTGRGGVSLQDPSQLT